MRGWGAIKLQAAWLKKGIEWWTRGYMLLPYAWDQLPTTPEQAVDGIS